MELFHIPIDGNWVDIGSLVSGVFYVFLRKLKNPHGKLVSKQTGIDFANGASLFPLLILSLSVMSSALIKGLMDASKMSLSVAGFFALLAILEEKSDDKTWF